MIYTEIIWTKNCVWHWALQGGLGWDALRCSRGSMVERMRPAFNQVDVLVIVEVQENEIHIQQQCGIFWNTFYRFDKSFATLFVGVRPAETHQIPTQHILSLSLQTCSHHPGRLMPHNNSPWPAKIVSPEVLILHNVCRRVVSPVMIMYSCEGSDCDHKAPHSQPMRGRGECHQSVSRRWEIIALSLTEIDTNEDKKQSLHLGH